MCFYREDNKLLAKRVFAKFARSEPPSNSSEPAEVKQETSYVKQEPSYVKEEVKTNESDEVSPTQQKGLENHSHITFEHLTLPTRLPLSTDISNPSSERNHDSPSESHAYPTQMYNFNLSNALIQNFQPRKLHQPYPASYNYFRPQVHVQAPVQVAVKTLSPLTQALGQEVLRMMSVNTKYINQLLESQERSKKKLKKCLEELRGCRAEVEQKPVQSSPIVTKIHEARMEAEFHNNNPTSVELFNHLFPTSRIYKYKLVLTNAVQNPILRDKNLVLDINLIDVLTGEIVNNTNRVHLQVQLQTWEIPSNNITRNKNGNRAVSGQTETELKNGHAKFERVQVSEVTSKFMNGYVAIVIVPGQPSNHGTYLLDDEEQENFINFEDIRPLMIEKIVVKSKKKPFM